jgi:hypothetical protein
MNSTVSISIVILTIFVILNFFAYADEGVVRVPMIETLSKEDASKELVSIGLRPDFSACYSKSVSKNFIIPGTQDPKMGKEINVGDNVKATISLGPLPILTGENEKDALKLLNKINLTYEIIEDRIEGIPANYVYDQFPKGDYCFSQDEKLKLFVNAPLRVNITRPKEGERVQNTTTVEGTISQDLKDNENLWIVVRPYKSLANWWPQSGGPITPKNRIFKGEAYLGGVSNDMFEIGILIVDDKLNSQFEKWLINSSSLNQWPPITEGDPISRVKVSKYVIQSNKYASVNAILV